MVAKSILLGLGAILAQVHAAPKAVTPRYLISFGDSYSQTWFNISGEKPSPQNPLGNPPFPGWTAAGGANWVGSMVSEQNTSVALAYNFAYGGATIDADIVTPYKEDVQSFVDQVDIFLDTLAKKPTYAPWTATNAIAAVWIGVNDVGNVFWLQDRDEIIKRATDRYLGLLQDLFNAGLRQFAVLSVPPTNLTPLMLGNDEGSQASLVASIKLYNEQLKTGLKAFRKANPSAKAILVDTTDAFKKPVKKPKAYGSPDALCTNTDGVSCLWFDSYHPGVTIERLVAVEVAKKLRSNGIKW